MAQKKYLDGSGLSKFLENITNTFSKKNHTHTKSQITDFEHDHDDRYYTESEIDSKLSAKADVGHTHTVDSSLSQTSTNPVQNNVINDALAAKQDAMKTVAIPSSSSTNKGKWIRFATVDLASAAAWAACSGTLSFIRNEGESPLGLLKFEFRNGGTAGTVTTNELYWTNLNNGNHVSAVASVKVSNGRYDIYYKPINDYETPVVSLIDSANTKYFSFNIGSYVSSITAATTSGVTSYASSAGSVAWSDVSGKPSTYAPSSHNHNDIYYTESEINSKVETLNSAINSKATISHTHEIDDISNLQAALDGKAESSHTHSVATVSNDGFMSYSDKSKLDGIASGANKYVLPIAGASIGGVKSGTDITVDTYGNVSVNNDSHSHSANTITSVNASAITGVIAEANLPSYVDDVLEYDSKDDFPAKGESGKIYVDIATNLAYRWSGSAYVEISPSLALGETSATAYRGDRGKIAYEHSQKNGNPHGTTIADISGLQSALDGKADSSHTHNYAGSSSAGGSANSAVKLATARTIGAGTAVTSTAQGFNGESNITIPINSVKESYLDWGGKGISGSVSPVGMALSPEHNANRLAFINGNALTMEYSSDGGSTWKDYGYSADIKSQFCTTNAGIPIGRASASSNYTTSSRTRITIDGQSYVYTNPRKLLINISSSGQMKVLVEYKTGASGASWQTFGTYDLVGWTGWNDIPLVLDTFGCYSGVTTTNRYLRMTFIMASVDSNYPTTAQVSGIRLFGSDSWISASESNNKGVMSSMGHLYSYDIDANATFPADVKALSFSGALNGSINPVTTTGTGDAYVANVNGITSLSVGANFIMVPHTQSTVTNPTLDVNGLGAKTIRVQLSNSSSTSVPPAQSNFLGPNKPVKMMYNGNNWVAQLIRPDSSGIYGQVKIENGGTGADTAAKARQNLGITTANGTTISTNADYAEVGEWADGNANDEDRIGYFVAIDDSSSGATMVKAKSTSDVRGVTVAAPAFSGNCSDDKFDESGELLKQYDYVAVMGMVSIIDNGTCTVNGRCMPTDDGTAIPSPNNMGYQIISRIDDTHVLIAVEPEADMMVRVKSDIEELQNSLPVFSYGTDAPTSDTSGCFYIQVL